MENLCYLLGIAWQPLPYAGAYKNGGLLVYCRDNQKISFVEGPSPHCPSSLRSAQEWLSFQPRYLVTYEEKNQIVTEAPGWFERKCTEAGCGWFIPIVRRIATGEKVSLKEITSTYSAHHEGKIIPSGKFYQVVAIARRNFGW